MMIISQLNTTPIDSDFYNVAIIGDSISRGRSEGTVNAPAGTLFEYNNGSLNEVSDIVDAATGSYVPKLAERLNVLTGKKLNVSTNGSGGSKFSTYDNNNDWSTTGDLYDDMVTDVNSLTASTGQGLDAIIIILGINDARKNATIPNIQSDVVSLINRLNSTFTYPKIFIVQIGKTENGVTTRTLQVRDMISNGVNGVVESYNNVRLGADLSTYIDDMFFDGLHLSQDGNNNLGTELANNMYLHL